MPPYAADTILAQGSGQEHDATGAIVPPIHLATTFLRSPEDEPSGGWSYSRYGYPGLEQPETTLKTLEGAAGCRLFSSGMSAMTAVIMALRPGDHCVFPIDMYHGLKTWLKAHSSHWNVRIDHVDMTDPDKVHATMIPGVTRLVWLETPSNPHWHIYDIAGLAEIAHRAGARTRRRQHCGDANTHPTHKVGRRHRRSFSHQIPERTQRCPGWCGADGSR
ncbi:PLP-dependent transferase [Mesorhizobium amorphae]